MKKKAKTRAAHFTTTVNTLKACHYLEVSTNLIFQTQIWAFLSNLIFHTDAADRKIEKSILRIASLRNQSVKIMIKTMETLWWKLWYHLTSKIRKLMTSPQSLISSKNSNKRDFRWLHRTMKQNNISRNVRPCFLINTKFKTN